jgi:hypothetical protein
VRGYYKAERDFLGRRAKLATSPSLARYPIILLANRNLRRLAIWMPMGCTNQQDGEHGFLGWHALWAVRTE